MLNEVEKCPYRTCVPSAPVLGSYGHNMEAGLSHNSHL